jgi:N-methyl-L-proline demethylase
VLGERGHDVRLFEAGGKVGGKLLLASLAPRRRDLRGIVDWRTDELARLGVPVSLNTYVTGRTLLDQSWDVVIVATGGTPAAPRVPGAGLVHDTWDVLAGARRPQGRVMVYDDHGGNQALDAVEALLRGGATVEIVTPERTLSPDVGSLTAPGYVNSLAENGVTVTVLRRLHRVTKTPEGLEVELGVDGFEFREHRTFDAAPSWPRWAPSRSRSSMASCLIPRPTWGPSTWRPCWPAGPSRWCARKAARSSCSA